MSNTPKLTYASELYAMSQGAKCEGDQECHYCGSACERKWIHDDPKPIPFTKNIFTAKRPSNSFVCMGCWLFRRTRITIRYMNGEIKDRQDPANHSWLITDNDAQTISHMDFPQLYSVLLYPPLRFSLSFITDPNCKNLLQCQVVNDLDCIQANTSIYFTINNSKYEYTIYELEESLKHGGDGKIAGARALVELMGPYNLPEEKKRKRGRPSKDEELDAAKTVRRTIK